MNWSTWYGIYPRLAASLAWSRPWLSESAVRDYGITWPSGYTLLSQVVVYAETEAGPPKDVMTPRAALFHMTDWGLSKSDWNWGGAVTLMIPGTPVFVYHPTLGGWMGRGKVFLFGLKVRCNLMCRSFQRSEDLLGLGEWGEDATMTVQARPDAEVSEKLLGILMPHLVEYGLDWQILGGE